MDLNQWVDKSRKASAKASRLMMQASQLSRQVKQAICDRASILAEDQPDATFTPNNTFGGGMPCKVVARWSDERGTHRVVITEFRDVWSITDTPGRPCGRRTSTHRLKNTPLEHLAEHFGPLMKTDYATAATTA